MKSQLCLFVLAALFGLKGLAQEQNQLVLTNTTVQAKGNNSIVELEFKNAFDQSIQSIRVLIILFNENGKAVGNKSLWLGGSKFKELNFEPKKSATFLTRVQTSEKAVKADVLIIRVVLKDGSKPNLSRSFKKKTK
jgi:hypothetical protein